MNGYPTDYGVTVADGIREYVREVGRERPDVPWILSDWDTWHRNPFYDGPEVPHPED